MSGSESSDRSRHGEVVALFGTDGKGPRAAAPRPARVLIVDDQYVGRHTLEGIVQSLGWEVDARTLNDPREALSVAQSFRPDLLVTDFLMPGLAGDALVRAFRRLPGAAAVPVLMVTIVEDPSVRYAALEAGATVVLQRPLDHHECCLQCRNLLALRFEHLRERLLPMPPERKERRLQPRELERPRASVTALGELVDACRRVVDGAGAVSGIPCEVQVPGDLPTHLCADIPAIRYALYHLLAGVGGTPRSLALGWTPVAGVRGWLDLRLEAECSCVAQYAVGDRGGLWRRQADAGPDLGSAEDLVRVLGGTCRREVTPTRTHLAIRIPARSPPTVMALGNRGFGARLRPWLEPRGLLVVEVQSFAAALAALCARRGPGGLPRRLIVEQRVLGTWVAHFPPLLATDPALADVVCVLVADPAAPFQAQTAGGYTAVLSEPLTREAVVAALGPQVEPSDAEPCPEVGASRADP